MSHEDSSQGTVVDRLGVTFHRSFSMNRSAVSQVLQLSEKTSLDGDIGYCLSRDTIRELSHLGTIYVESMPRYGYGMGLLNSGYCLTPFGKSVLTSDRLLEKPDTQWLMHYFLSASNGPGPRVWHEIVRGYFRTGNVFSSDEIISCIARVFAKDEGKTLAERSVRTSATVFLGTYVKDEALGRLGLLGEIGSSGKYQVLDPDPPSAWAFGYALLHYWKSVFGDLLTINLDALYEEGGLGSLFMCGSGRVNRMLTSLQMEGFVDVFRVAPPYQLVLLRSDPDALLQKIYGSYEST